MDDYRTDELLRDDLTRQSFYSAMRALLTRADEIREISPHMAIEDMVAAGYMLRYLDPHDRVELFDDIRSRLA